MKDDNAEGRRGCVDAELLDELRRILPQPGALLSTEEELRPYECDGLTAYRRLPGAVALPETVQQVQAILKACHRRHVAVVARGAGTGLSGGALPLDEGVLLSLARFNRILSIDPLARVAHVQPGVRNLAIRRLRGSTVFITRPIRPRKSPAASAATWQKIPVACIASNTG